MWVGLASLIVQLLQWIFTPSEVTHELVEVPEIELPDPGDELVLPDYDVVPGLED